VPLHGIPQDTRVFLALRRDPLVDQLSELDPGVPGSIGVLAADLVAQPRGLLVLRQDLVQDRVLDVAALDDVLRTAVKLGESSGELIAIGRQQLLGHRVLARQDRAEAQRQDGKFCGARVQDLLVGPEVFG